MLSFFQKMKGLAVLKAITYFGLFSTFFFGYFLQIISQYSSKMANYSRRTEPVKNGIKFPTMTFCLHPNGKPSMKSKFEIKDDFFFYPNKTVLDNDNITLENVIDYIYYKIDRDFEIHVRNFDYDFKLDLGKNEVEFPQLNSLSTESTLLDFEVRESFSQFRGKCYTIISK